MTDLETLRAREKRYAGALQKVRDLIAFLTAEQPQSNGTHVTAATTPAETRNPQRESFSAFAQLTKGDAAEQIFRERSDLSVAALFDAMHALGHPVKNARSLMSMLSGDARFTPRGGGVWGLAQAEISTK